MTTSQHLDERYGRVRRGRLPWVIGGLVAVIAIVIGGWITVRSSIDAVDITDLGFHVADEHSVTIDFQIVAPHDRPVYCALEALDEEFGIVGWRIVEYSPSESRARAFTERIPTVAEATTGLVNTCWVA